jgi:hypothetical protein
MVCVKMTSQGPQIDDGQDKTVMILRSKDQRHSLHTGGLPMVQVKMSPAGPQVQNLSSVQEAPPQIQSPQPGLSQPRGTGFSVPSLGQVRGTGFVALPMGQARVVRVAAPKQVTLPTVPEFTMDKLMLCRHLVGKYLADLRADLRAVEPSSTSAVESVEAVETLDAAATPKEGSGSDNVNRTEASSVPPQHPGAAIVDLAEATIEMLDQALVAVAVRAEADAASTAPIPLDQEVSAVTGYPELPAVPAVSIIPAAPSASYVAGRVGGRTNGYSRPQRNGAMAPRRVPRSGSLPPVIVKMEGDRAVVQNRAEVTAAREAVVTRMTAPESASVPEAPDGNTQG